MKRDDLADGRQRRGRGGGGGGCAGAWGREGGRERGGEEGRWRGRGGAWRTLGLKLSPDDSVLVCRGGDDLPAPHPLHAALAARAAGKEAAAKKKGHSRSKPFHSPIRASIPFPIALAPASVILLCIELALAKLSRARPGTRTVISMSDDTEHSLSACGSSGPSATSRGRVCTALMGTRGGATPASLAGSESNTEHPRK